VRARHLPPFGNSEFAERGRVLTRDGMSCVFLGEDNLCSLHAALGPGCKPRNCIDFPFHFAATPGGVYAGVSFACTAVLEDAGPLVSDQRESLAAGYRESVNVRRCLDRPRLTGRIDIDFDAYLEVESAYDEILRLGSVPLGLRLLAGMVYVDMTAKLFEAARLGEAPASITAREGERIRAASDRELAAGMAARLRADGWGRPLALAARSRPAPALERAFLGLVTSFRQALGRDTSRLRAMATIARQYLAHALGVGAIRLEPFNRPFRHADLRRIAIDRSQGSEFDRLLSRYFRHALFRKDLLTTETIRAGCRFMLMHYALVNWYIVAVALESGGAAADEAAVREALRHVERYYVHHSTFTSILEGQATLGTLIDRVIHGARYPGAMIHAAGGPA